MDAIVVASVSAQVQRDRVLARPGMTDAHFARILATQIPDDEKRRKADYVILTESLEGARSAVREVLSDIRRRRMKGT